MRFLRNTHLDGKPRADLVMSSLTFGMWPTCDLQMLSSDTPMTVDEIHEAHAKYDREWGKAEGYNFVLADILEGLAHHIRLSTVKAVWD